MGLTAKDEDGNGGIGGFDGAVNDVEDERVFLFHLDFGFALRTGDFAGLVLAGLEVCYPFEKTAFVGYESAFTG